jgi:subtilisin family serine protease
MYGLYPSSGAYAGYTYVTNVRIGSVDTDIEEMIDAGIVVCIAAGNRSHKIDVVGGSDYDNYITADTGVRYYNRGSSPYSSRAFMVGSMDSTTYDATNDQKATYSETGPGVNMWAPGTNIMSACSNTNAFSGQNYHLNASFKQVNISGTSMASPQVAGVAALYLQKYPTATPAYTKLQLELFVSDDIYTTGLTNDYSNTRSLLGSSKYVLYSAFQAQSASSPLYTVAPNLVVGGSNISFGGAGISFT